MKNFLIVLICFCIASLLFLCGFLAYRQIKYPLQYKTEIKNASEEYNLSPTLVASIINAESSFVPNKISKAGAVGLMQIMPKTAKFVCEKIGTDYSIINLENPQTNIEIGCYYLSYLSKKYSDLFTLLCAYNAGEGNVSKWLKVSKYSSNKKSLFNSPFPQTNAYASKILKSLAFYKGRL